MTPARTVTSTPPGERPAMGGALAGVAMNHNALDAAGPQAMRIEHLWWIFLAVAIAVYLLSMLFVLLSVRKSRQRRQALTDDPPTLAIDAPRERRVGAVVWGSLVVTTIILFILMLSDFFAGRAIDAQKNDASMTIQLTGHQWWWEAQYVDPIPGNSFTVANELHIPVGATVQIELRSADVIHSFWIPNLHGKRDMIPDHPTRIYIKADRAGTYVGQCAEFCGFQHAKMRLVVVAEDPDTFHKWAANQWRSAVEPTTDVQKRGQEVFLTRTCVMCHSISGTIAHARVGPDLSHVGSRRMLAANSIPNTHGDLGGWIADPQSIKPSVHMPPNPLPPEDLRALLEYLENLK